jgi:hypothetical protein
MAFPWIAAAIAGSTVVSAMGQRQANKQAASSAREQMEFQREMSNTAHQRQVADLRSAGLNPILSAHKSGASTPQGAKYEPKNPFEKLVQNVLMGAQAETALANAQSAKEQARLTGLNADMESDTLKKLRADGMTKLEADRTPWNYWGSKMFRTGYDTLTEIKNIIQNYSSSAKEAKELEGAVHRSFMDAQRANPKMNPYSRKSRNLSGYNRSGKSRGDTHKIPRIVIPNINQNYQR